MTESAKRKLKAEKKSKKRKSKGEVSASKKQKKDDSEAALKSAQDKHAKLRAGSKPIFVQPHNLADDCLLKDYQLVGVRWLASLFENGVSGILADGKKRFTTLYEEFLVLIMISLTPASVLFHRNGSWKDHTSDRFNWAPPDSWRFRTVSNRSAARHASELGSRVRKVAPSTPSYTIPRTSLRTRGFDEGTTESQKPKEFYLSLYCHVLRGCNQRPVQIGAAVRLYISHR